MQTMKIFLRRAALALAMMAVLAVCALAADATASTPAEFYGALEQNLRAQKASFTIAYTGDRQTLNASESEPLATMLRNLSARSPDGPDNADYPALNISEGQAGWLDDTCYFELEYLATQAQIDEVSRRAGEIVKSFRLDGEDDFTKIKLLYEYICTHYTYDDTLTKFSAYDGLTTGSMVCQGYALLTYRVMWNAGIPCRIVTGVSSMQNHAWNIVRLNGRWYNLDTTWDAASEIGGVMNWDFFLKNQADFVGHTRFSPYDTADYQAAHPMADTSAALPRVTVQVNGGNITSLIVRAGVEVQMEAVLPTGMGSEIQWVSSNPDVVQVTADGRLTASTPGNTVITAQIAGKRGIISARVTTQAVDLRTSSSWAFDAVTEYYLAQMLPASLCSDFQKGITRGELARLCYQYVLYQRGWGEMILNNPFDDLYDCPDQIAILRCRSIGLMEGTSPTTFSPDRPVTREQAAKVLVRLAEYLDGKAYEGTGSASYSDSSDVSRWAVPFVSAATDTGVLQGTGSAFHPRGRMTREQMIVALHRIYEARADHRAAA